MRREEGKEDLQAVKSAKPGLGPGSDFLLIILYSEAVSNIGAASLLLYSPPHTRAQGFGRIHP